ARSARIGRGFGGGTRSGSSTHAITGTPPPAVKNLSRPPVALATPIPALSSSEVTTGRIFDRLAVVVLGAVGIVALLTFRDYGLSWDDYTHSEYGDLLLKFYLSGLRDQRALSSVNLYY